MPARSSRALSLALSLPLAALCLADRAASQTRHGIHPWVADIDPAFAGEILATSTLFNPPDNVWNHGEGFVRATPGASPADTGGFFSIDDGSTVEPGDIHVQFPAGNTSAWNDHTALDLSGVSRTVSRLVGFLHPSPPPGTDGFAAENAFEVFAPKLWNPSKQTVLVIAVQGAINSGAIIGGYPGAPVTSFTDQRNAGLIPAVPLGARPPFADVQRPQPVDRIAAMSGTPAADSFNIIAAYIVPPHRGGHLLHTSQRVLQLARAVALMFAGAGSAGDVPAEWGAPTGPFALLVAGGSNGGHVAQAMALHFPDKVHAAVSYQFSASMRRVVSQQEFCVWLTALQSFDGSTLAHGVVNRLPFTAFYEQLGFTYATGTTLPMLQDGLAKRPMFLLASDEDTTWTGEDGITLLAGTNDAFPSGMRTINGARIFWSVQDKSCHDAWAPIHIPAALLSDPTGTVPPGAHPLADVQTEYWAAFLPMLDEAVAELTQRPFVARPDPTEATPPAPSLGAHVNSEQDPYDHAVARPSTRERRSEVRDHPAHPFQQLRPNLLTEVPEFRREAKALGGWVGNTHALQAGASNRIWVGSADGVVSKLVRDFANPLSPTSLRVEERCRLAQEDPTDGPFSLGYGVFALDVDGQHLAFATHRHLWVYDLSQGLGAPAFDVELSWGEQRPVKLELVDDFLPGAGKCIVYLSYLGEVVVRRVAPGLPSIAEMSNPGFFTFTVGPNTPKPGWSKELFVSGQQGQVFRLVFAPSATPPSTTVNVVGASPRIGLVKDLLWSDTLFGSGLVGVVEDGPSPGIVMFDAASQPALAIRYSVALPEPPAGAQRTGARDGEPRVVSLWGADLYALLYQGSIYLMPGGDLNAFIQSFGGAKLTQFGYEVMRFPAATNAIAIAASDMEGDGVQDLVIATQNGQVAWIPDDYLLALSSLASLTPIAGVVLGSEWYGEGAGVDRAVPDAFSSGSSSATWGMAFGRDEHGVLGRGPIETVDQCARREQVDRSNGVRKYTHLVANTTAPAVPAVAFPAPKPFRGLAWLGEDPPAFDLPGAWQRHDAGDDVPPGSGWPGRRFRFLTNLDLAVAPGSAFPVTPDSGAGHVSYVGVLHQQLFDDRFLPFSFGGDVLHDGGAKYGVWWAGSEPAAGHDIVRGVLYGTALGPFAVFGSSTNSALTPATPFQAHLRNAISAGTPHDAGSLRLGLWDEDGVRAVVGTMGGGILVLDPEAPPAACLTSELAPNDGDHGFGGIALCVRDVRGAGAPTIFFGTLHAHANPAPVVPSLHDLVSSLHVYHYRDATGLQLGESVVFDGDGRPKLVGLCGLAAGDLVPDSDGIDDELVLTTLNGDLLVYDLELSGVNGGVALGPLLHWDVYDGALGANNAILIDEASVPRAVFVAGTMGMRKFVVAP